MFNLFFASLKQSFQFFRQMVTGSLGTWVVVGTFSFGITAFVDTLMGDTPQDMTNARIFGMALAIPIEILLSLVVLAVVSIHLNDTLAGKESRNPWEVLAAEMKPLTIENLRALAKILLWGLLLVLPGIYQMLRYSFVSFVVLFDPNYRAGRVDALKESAQLTKGLKRYLVLLFILSAGFEIFSAWIKKVDGGQTTLLMTAVAVALRLVFDIYTQSATFLLFRARSQQRDTQG